MGKIILNLKIIHLKIFYENFNISNFVPSCHSKMPKKDTKYRAAITIPKKITMEFKLHLIITVYNMGI